ncbi:hypothetical protein D9M68_967550 [compost metagenome]
MKIKTDFSGLDRLKKNLQELEQTKQVKLGELLNPGFVSKHTPFADLEAMFDASGFKVETAEDFQAIPDAEWEAFIVANSSFDSWQAMQQAALGELVSAKLKK